MLEGTRMTSLQQNFEAGSSSAALDQNSSHEHTVTHQHPNSDQNFGLDSFHFGADFSLPSSLDDLSIFQTVSHVDSSNSTAESQHHPLPQSKALGKVHSSSNSVIGSPHDNSFSPSRVHDQVMHNTNSQHASPNQVYGGSEASGSSHHDSATHEKSQISFNDLQQLLSSIQESALSQHHHQQQIQGNSLPLAEVDKLSKEKDQIERLQSQQISFLRHQLDTLQQQIGQSIGQSSAQGSHYREVAQLMQQFEQISSFQNAIKQTGQGSSASLSSAQLPAYVNYNKNLAENPTFMSQYGLVTPLSSGGLAQLPRGKDHFVSPLNIPGTSHPAAMDGKMSHDAGLVNGSFTPLESPAITPASVFSTVGSVATTSADIFSPLTSPALRPQIGSSDVMGIPISPYHGPTQPRYSRRFGKGTTPNASPNGPQPTKSLPRKNRSTTAEARANRSRPSPLVKPTSGTRKRVESLSGTLPSPLGPSVIGASVGGMQLENGDRSQQELQSFPPLSGNSGSTKPMDTSPSETGASTPSPIEMPPPNGKPITPGSLMGIKSKDSNSGAPQPAIRPTHSKAKENDTTSKSVSFAHPSSPSSLQNLVPGDQSHADREAWISNMKASGGAESRRTSHKAAEQKRRDSLKFCFDELRGMLPPITLDDELPGGSMLGPDGLIEDQEDEMFNIEDVGDAESARTANRAISKVALLRHSNEYLIRLKGRLSRRDRDLTYARREILELRAQLGLPIPPKASLWLGMGVGPSPLLDHNVPVDQYQLVQQQQQLQAAQLDPTFHNGPIGMDS